MFENLTRKSTFVDIENQAMELGISCEVILEKNRIIQYQKDYKLSTTALAKRLEKGVPYFSQLLKDLPKSEQKNPSIEYISDISYKLTIPIEDLITIHIYANSSTQDNASIKKAIYGLFKQPNSVSIQLDQQDITEFQKEALQGIMNNILSLAQQETLTLEHLNEIDRSLKELRVYSEKDLILPALKHIFLAGKMTTSELIDALSIELKPAGRDLEKLKNRKDTHFSQKVRNLKSHNTLENTGYAIHNGDFWQLTPKGIHYVLKQGMINLNDLKIEGIQQILETIESEQIEELIHAENNEKQQRVSSTKSLYENEAAALFLQVFASEKFEWNKEELHDRRYENIGFDFEAGPYKFVIKHFNRENDSIQFTNQEWKMADVYQDYYIVFLANVDDTHSPSYKYFYNPTKIPAQPLIKKTVCIVWTIQTN
ncbi:hypothetical protein [Alkalihalobacillus sp. BA299]|uniref:hypothetical protein n=1 Tax=Alkalihalobacillus sp. BA299 TaxID=2815938 RepID=UPI001ADAC27F|nr:hypothetical protein [Alkalihalobacillus sp. BA299]